MPVIEYVVDKIWGDYAYLRPVAGSEDPEPVQVALALLPDGIDEGTLLIWENFVYCIKE